MLRYLPLAALLAGCSTPPMSAEQITAMNPDTLRIDCEAGCSVAYTDPRDRPQMPTNGWDTANRAIDAAAGVITSTAPWAAVTLTGLKGIKDAGSTDNRVDSSVRTDSSDNRVDNSTDSTHTPTVVEQPEPTVVQQPSPIATN